MSTYIHANRRRLQLYQQCYLSSVATAFTIVLFFTVSCFPLVYHLPLLAPRHTISCLQHSLIVPIVKHFELSCHLERFNLSHSPAVAMYTIVHLTSRAHVFGQNRTKSFESVDQEMIFKRNLKTVTTPIIFSIDSPSKCCKIVFLQILKLTRSCEQQPGALHLLDNVFLGKVNRMSETDIHWRRGWRSREFHISKAVRLLCHIATILYCRHAVSAGASI